MLFDHALIVDDKPYSNSTKLLHMTSTTMLTEAKFQNPPLLKLLLDISVNFRSLYVIPSKSHSEELTRSRIKTAQQVEDSYQRALENHEEDLKFLNSQEDSNWMEDSFQKALEYPDDEWGRADYIFNEKAPPVNAKRLYRDMRSSNLGYSQGGTFPAEVSEGDEGEEDIEGDYQPPRTRRRLD